VWELASLLPGVLSSRLSLAAEPGVWGPVNRRAIDALYDIGGLFGDVESGLCHSVLHRRSNHNRERAARADHARRAPAARGQDRGPLRRRALLGVLRDEHVEVLQAALEHGVRKLVGEHRLRARGRPSSEPNGPAGGPCEQAGLTWAATSTISSVTLFPPAACSTARRIFTVLSSSQSWKMSLNTYASPSRPGGMVPAARRPRA